MAFDLSTKLEFCSHLAAERTRAHYAAVGLPTDPSNIEDVIWNADALMAHMLLDKKTENGKVIFILAEDIGKSFVAHNINMNDVQLIVEQAILNN
jgi:3-dehydroquinate synthetase